jgi:hypothetical protein
MCGLGLCYFTLSHSAASALQQSYATQRVKPCWLGSKTEYLWTERSGKILWNDLETERTYVNKFLDALSYAVPQSCQRSFQLRQLCAGRSKSRAPQSTAYPGCWLGLGVVLPQRSERRTPAEDSTRRTIIKAGLASKDPPVLLGK